MSRMGSLHVELHSQVTEVAALERKAMEKSNQQGVLEKSWALRILQHKEETVTAPQRDS